MNASTTKISAVNHDEAFFVEINNVFIRAERRDGYATSKYNPETGKEEFDDYRPDYYTISSFNNGSAYKTQEFDTLQELANAMREIADLRKWRTLYDADGEPRI